MSEFCEVEILISQGFEILFSMDGTGKEIWDLKISKACHFQTFFSQNLVAFPSVSHIDIVTGLTKNNTRFHLDYMVLHYQFMNES